MKASQIGFALFLVLLFSALCFGQTTYNYSGSKRDFNIDATNGTKYTFKLRGGDGGFAKVKTCSSGGGNGAFTEFTVTVGDGSGQLPVGTKVRIIVGGKGSDQNLNSANTGARGSGGGGSAVLAQINGDWEILGVAGGGGGAYQGRALGFCVDNETGQGGRSSTSGGNGGGTYGGDGGSNGNGGTGGGDSNFGFTDLAGGGGGASSDGSGSNNLDGSDDVLGGKKGLNIGGNGGSWDNTHQGGWGFGGGGSGDSGGGGGGGYSGGGGGSELDNGGGGGSYVNATYATNSTITASGSDTNTEHGYVEMYKDCGDLNITGFSYINPLCTENDQGRIQFSYTSAIGDICEDVVNWRIDPINGWNYLGDGIFRSMQAGDYTLTVSNTDFDQVLATYNFTVAPNGIAPEARCKNVTITLQDGVYNNPDFADLINNGSTSFCDEPLTLSASRTSFDCTDGETKLVGLTVTGHNGVSDICNAVVTIIYPEDEASVANCKPSFSVDLVDGPISLTPDDLNDGSILSLCWLDQFVSPNIIACRDVGTVDVTLLIEDFNGVQSECITTINVLDSGQPTANCKSTYELLLQGDGTASLSAADLNNGSLSNNCTDLSFTADIINFDCNDIGPNTVTMTATDGYNRTSTCQTTVNIVEIASPVALCRNITVGLDENGDYDLTAAEIDNGSNAGCSTALSSSVVSFDCDDLGEQVVTLTATSAFNQQATCQATVMVVDTIPPTAVCDPFTLNNFPVSINPFRTAIFQDQEDNCGVASTVFLDDTYFDCDEVGLQLVRIEVVDDSGNRDTCAIHITINAEAETVVASCNDNNNVVELDDGTYFLDEAALYNLLRFSPGVDCHDFSTLNPTTSQSVFTCSHLGAPMPVTVSLTDPGGETTSCVLSIEAVDEVNPVCASAPQVNVKVILSGPYDTSTGLMQDDLRTMGLIPTTSPYGNGAQKTTSAVLAIAGINAIVDWVQLEIRSAAAPTQLLYTRSALLQRDGDIVDLDGVSPIYLTSVPAGTYYVAVNHRNHLAMMTGTSVLLN